MLRIAFVAALAALTMACASRPAYDWGALAKGVEEARKR